jgi:hypothetical protein
MLNIQKIVVIFVAQKLIDTLLSIFLFGKSVA